MRHLRGAGQCGAARVCVERGMGSARFERRRVLPVRLRSEANAPRRLGQGGIEIRGLELAVDHDISDVMHGRRVRRQRGARVANSGQFGDLDLDAIRRIFGLRRRRREHRGDRFADETHHLSGEDWLRDREIVVFVQHRPDWPSAEIGSANDGNPIRCGDVHDPPRRYRAAHEPDEVRGGKIAGEPPAAAHQRRVLEAPDRAADPFHSRTRGRDGRQL